MKGPTEEELIVWHELATLTLATAPSVSVVRNLAKTIEFWARYMLENGYHEE